MSQHEKKKCISHSDSFDEKRGCALEDVLESAQVFGIATVGDKRRILSDVHSSESRVLQDGKDHYFYPPRDGMVDFVNWDAERNAFIEGFTPAGKLWIPNQDSIPLKLDTRALH